MSGRDGMILCIGGPADGTYVDDYGPTMKSPYYPVRYIVSRRYRPEPERITLSFVTYRKELLRVKDWQDADCPAAWQGRDSYLYVVEGLTLFDALLKVLSYYARDCQRCEDEERMPGAR